MLHTWNWSCSNDVQHFQGKNTNIQIFNCFRLILSFLNSISYYNTNIQNQNQNHQGLKQQSPTLTSLPLFSSLVPLFTWVSQNPFKQNQLLEAWREKEWARQRKRMRERVLSLINSTAGFLSFTECWDLIDDGLFTCGDRRGFRCSSAETSHINSAELLFFVFFPNYFISWMQKTHWTQNILNFSVALLFSDSKTYQNFHSKSKGGILCLLGNVWFFSHIKV